MSKSKFKTQQIVLTGMLAALSGVLMSLEIPIPFFPPFYKFDFSSTPAIIGLFLMGPVEGILIEVIKLVIKLMLVGTNSMYIGELFNLISIFLFIVPTWFIFKKGKETRKAAAFALAANVVIQTVSACFLNAFISLPLYASAMKIPLDKLVSSFSGGNGSVKNLLTFIIFATVPFNILKSGINSFTGYFLYRRLTAALPAARALRSHASEAENG
jgi:riboflavin transporter FmnP